MDLYSEHPSPRRHHGLGLRDGSLIAAGSQGGFALPPLHSARSAAGGATSVSSFPCSSRTRAAGPREESEIAICEVQSLQQALTVLERNDPRITTLMAKSCQICDGHFDTAALAGALSRNATVTTLDLRENRIGNSGAESLADALAMNSALKTLILGQNSVREQGAKKIAEALNENQTLTSLDLSDNGLEHYGAEHFSKVLASCNRSLRSLSLAGNNLQHIGASHFGLPAIGHSQLTSLDLSRNDLGDRGAEVLAIMLRVNHTLTHLTLRANWIGARGASCLASSLASRNATLMVLDLVDNRLGDAGAENLLMGLMKNITLKECHVGGNSIAATLVRRINEVMEGNSHAAFLGVDRRTIGSETRRTRIHKTTLFQDPRHLRWTWMVP
mmetsp:Transcript_62113/g.148136  ORF Transcript_62113/g.148136 Transcript_62113/m.148136 type:complete len:387 (-) Transcript_62113:11-1171(-)